tara:strand:- start:1417 stop:2100 length:684 start_codon:yes stop_codon:yes gene_type:complete
MIKMMPFLVRPASDLDVAKLANIEKEAFPKMFPPTPFERELENSKARYLVAYLEKDSVNQTDQDFKERVVLENHINESITHKILQGIRTILNLKNQTIFSNEPRLVGFVGVWYMIDEAHIVSIGVIKTHRESGVGELLLISAIQQAILYGAKIITLEVRPSNKAAINLYKKYGLREMGLRKNYYSDNREDALIMTSSPIQEQEFQDLFCLLAQNHQALWGKSKRTLE